MKSQVENTKLYRLCSVDSYDTTLPKYVNAYRLSLKTGEKFNSDFWTKKHLETVKNEYL